MFLHGGMFAVGECYSDGKDTVIQQILYICISALIMWNVFIYIILL